MQEYTQEEMEDPYFRDQIAQLYNPLYNGMTDAQQYFENEDDIINEEECEESVNESKILGEMSA